MTGRLLHYTPKKMRFSRRHWYDGAGAYKPPGFWVSVEGERDWPEWCRAEGFGTPSRWYTYEVTLEPAANVLRVTTAKAIGLLHRRLCPPHDTRGYTASWKEVRQQFDGVIIAPYQWSCRHTYLWYYGWDCASGVIWNLNAIASVKLVSRPAARR